MARFNSDRCRILDEIVAQGVSARKAEKGFKAVIDLMKKALARGEEVEVPNGWLLVDDAPRRRQKLTKLQLIDGRKTYRLCVYSRQRKTVVFRKKKEKP